MKIFSIMTVILIAVNNYLLQSVDNYNYRLKINTTKKMQKYLQGLIKIKDFDLTGHTDQSAAITNEQKSPRRKIYCNN